MFVLTILLFGLSGLARIESALVPLPENLKVNSYVSHLDERTFSSLEVTEYVNIQDGSIRLDISDRNEKHSTKTSYFRLMSNNDREERVIDSTVIAYDPVAGTCSSVHTQVWPLKDLSRLLLELSTPKNKMMGINEGIPNRTFLGPASLLRMVYHNSDTLKLYSRTRDELGDRDELHFSVRLNQWDMSGQTVARLLVTVSADNLGNENGNSKMIGNTTLSQVDATSHLSRITLAILDEKSKNVPKPLNEHASPLLSNEMFMTDGRLVEQLTVSYNLIQEQSLSRHTGLEYLADEVDDPFMMPVGLSCGSFSSNRHFYVKASQFSGQFEAADYEGQFFVAYDEPSNHLRYDVLGKSKTIYSLNDYSVTYIADDSSPVDGVELEGGHQLNSTNNSTVVRRSGESNYYYDRSHCAQASLIGEPGPAMAHSSALYNRKKLVSILGLGEDVQLAYLGQRRLPSRDRNGQSASFEPVTCQVFERQLVDYAQLPALIQMHLRSRPSDKNNLSLIYYFVNEIDSQTKRSLFNEQLNPYESMWLKRIELYSRTGFSKYIYSNAQLTFSKSSWSLETVGEDTRNRESQLEHPVRSFDTLECWPERKAVQLDVVLTQQNPEEWKKKGFDFKESRLAMKQVESFEETIMTFLSRQLGTPRSQINGFQLAPKAPDNFESMIVRSKLTFPFSYIYREKFVGWVESYRPLLLKKQAVMISRKYLVLTHECSLDLATRLDGRYKFHMMFCPNFGCGLLLVDPPELIEEHEEENKKSNFHPVDSHQDVPLNLAIYNELCTIHLVSQTVQQQGLVSPDHRAELLAGTLERAALSVESYQLEPQTKEFKYTPYRAQVSKVFVTSDKSLQSYYHDERIIADICFTPQTQALKYQDPMELPYGDGSLMIKQLVMDRHHSQAHCRKACVLLNSCETYSYNHADRLCVLTNILPELLRDPDITFEQLKVSPEQCAIFALDQLARFRRTPAIITKQPADMIEYHGEQSNSSIILWDDLGGCARFAHSSSWAMAKQSDQYPLSSFGYMRLKRMCLIHGVDREQFLNQFSSARDHLIGNPFDLQRFTPGGGRDQLSELEAYETFQANPGQFYTRKFGYSIDIMGDIMSTGALTKLDDQDFDRCLEFCTNKDEGCVMFDFCAHMLEGKYTRQCYLLHVRSPFAINPLNELYEATRFGLSVPPLKLNSSIPEQKFTALEEDLYVEGRSKSQVVIKSSSHCQHYYLSGDNLYLKRLLAQDQEVADTNKPAKSSGERAPVQPVDGKFGHSSWWLMLLELFVGLTIGCGIFIIRPAIAALITERQVSEGVRELSNRRLDDIRQALGSRSWLHQADRSQRVEINEMVRMG